MTNRTQVVVRVANTPLGDIDDLAEDLGLTRSDVMRACLAVAFKYWTEVQNVCQKKVNEI